MRVAIVGGGPGGLFLAALLRRAGVEVVLFERNRADDTFGFGVVFSDRTLAAIDDADPVLRDGLAEHGVHWDDIEVRLKGERLRCGGNGMAAISRRVLLGLLRDRALEFGADLRFSTPVRLADLDGFDLVVAADGTGSGIRTEVGLATAVDVATAKFIWFGTDYRFSGLTFVHERGPHGVFAVHGYPISDAVSTFIVETDEPTWRAAGLDAFDVTQAPGPSDEKSKAYLEELFAEQIEGHGLLTNNSRWGNFRTRRSPRWSVLRPRPVAFVGDAVHTAHFSVGSGTKMAMEDAVALSAALVAHPGDLPAAFAAYEAAARPSVERIQGAARPSLAWWEHFGRYHDFFAPWQFAYHFLSRSISDARLARRAPGFVAASHRCWTAEHGAEPLASPLRLGGTTLPARDVVVTVEAGGAHLRLADGSALRARPAPAPGEAGWVEAPGDEAALPAVLDRFPALADAGVPLVAVHGGSSFTRTLVAEEARMVHRLPVLLVDPEPDGDAGVTAVLSGRADLVATSVRASVTSPLTALFAPRGIAVVGASRHPGKLGAVMARSLAGFPGPVTPVNARDGELCPSVAAAVERHGPVDLAVVCVPAAACAEAVEEAAAAGARAAVVCGGGFAESGPDGERHQAALAEVAARTGIRVLGPNTSGFVVPGLGLTASFVPGAADVRPGRVAVVAASGGVNHALAFLLTEAGHGVSVAVGLGNGVDITAPDVLDHLAADDATAAVALHVESVPHGHALMAAVARLTATRPVVALVVGRNDVAAFARSHTGALATSWRTTRAALRQAGAVVVDDERELVDAVGALSLVRLPASATGVGVLTAQAGPGLLLLDDLRGRGAAVPELTPATQAVLAGLLPPLTHQRNPVDTGRPDPAFGQVLSAVAADAHVDVVAGYALHEPDALDLAAAVDAAGAAVPLVVGIGGAGPDVTAARRALLSRGVPALPDPRGVAAAVAALLADARARRRPSGPAPTGARLADLPRGPFDEDQAKSLLDALGVATPPRRRCAGRAQAQRALTELGAPVAVKLLDAAVLHKTEVGGVRLGVRTPDELDAALAAVGAAEVLVERMAPDGVDLVVGARRDPVFGPVVLVGLGGTVAEALADVAVRVAPVHPDAAAAMVDELSGRALLDGWRGGPVLDRAALAVIVGALGALLLDHPHLAEVEINPLRLTAGGLVALDAVVTEESRAPIHR